MDGITYLSTSVSATSEYLLANLRILFRRGFRCLTAAPTHQVRFQKAVLLKGLWHVHSILLVYLQTGETVEGTPFTCIADGIGVIRPGPTSNRSRGAVKLDN
jgi:hypothetical protein